MATHACRLAVAKARFTALIPDTPSPVLQYAVRPRVVAHYLGQLAVMLAILMLVPLAVAIVEADPGTAIRYLGVAVPLLVAGWPLARRPVPGAFQANEALVISALAFVGGALALTFPLMGAGLGLLDALFEATSAITTTGLSVAGGIEQRPATFLFARAWFQWCGGLGIVVLTVALLFGYDAAARPLTESPVTHENLDTSTRVLARRSFVAYAVLTVIGVAALWLAGLPPLGALAHALAAVSTGGFSTHDASLAAVPGWAPAAIVAALAVAGATALPLHYSAWRGAWREYAGNLELRALLVSVAVIAVLLALAFRHQQGSWTPALFGQAAFMATSAQTTTGFSTLPVVGLDPAAKTTLIVSMAVGGSVGSTAGGIKLWRLLLLLRLGQFVIRRTAMPSHAVVKLRLGGRAIEADELARALFLILLFVAAVTVSWLPFLWFGHDPLDSLFEVVSALGTVGLSTGTASPGLHPLLKGVLCVDMLLGRLEIVAVLVLLTPRTWFGRRMRA
jgi:trk system potassium uptake protein TrkH